MTLLVFFFKTNAAIKWHYQSLQFNVKQILNDDISSSKSRFHLRNSPLLLLLKNALQSIIEKHSSLHEVSSSSHFSFASSCVTSSECHEDEKQDLRERSQETRMYIMTHKVFVESFRREFLSRAKSRSVWQTKWGNNLFLSWSLFFFDNNNKMSWCVSLTVSDLGLLYSLLLSLLT